MPVFFRFALRLVPWWFAAAAALAAPSPWPETTREHRPWIRWWWPGSAVSPAGLTGELEAFAAAGLGGVEVTPIYGAQGAEAQDLPFLSRAWVEALAHTGREAQRLGLGVDTATGTGWPFGGPWVTPAEAAQRLAVRDGALAGEPTGMQVKRAAPGGAGPVVDPYSRAALTRYLAPIGEAWAALPAGILRAQFHDSFEYYEAGWTPALGSAFRTLHGYDLAPHAAELVGERATDPDTLRRLKSDYRSTLAALHLDYLQAWAEWSHARGWLVRNQSHGAPANLLDLYGAVDIPETETFGSTPFPIPGLRREWTSDRDIPDTLMLRFAASAAHVMGRSLVSSETCTWLREHWQEPLSAVKPEIDRLFADGINHVIYHGAAYSPPGTAWPGWLFYAATEFNPRNPWWRDFGALNAYVTRVQSVLQAGQPDADVLVYWPFYDVIDEPAGLMRQYGVHDVRWLRESPFGALTQQLLAAGYAYDAISDAQVALTEVREGRLVTPGHRYRVLLVPAVRRLPLATLERLLELARAGGQVVFAAEPEDVPGLGRLAERRAAFAAARTALPASGAVVAEPLAALRQCGVAAEPASAQGLLWQRRARADGHDYFFANLGGRPFDGWLELGRPAASAELLDALTGAHGRAALRTEAAGATAVYLQLAPGESRLLRTTSASAAPAGAPWPYAAAAGAPYPLAGDWTLTFVEGGPVLPAPRALPGPGSWTDPADTATERFSGAAVYRLEFDAPPAPAGTGDWRLDLGDVRESARVRLNGVALGTAWSLPFHVRLGATLRPGRNVLELEVTNLGANRIRDLDRRGVRWKVMREINYVDLRYRPFNAAEWPVTPSGLLTPLTLTPLRLVFPQ